MQTLGNVATALIGGFLVLLCIYLFAIIVGGGMGIKYPKCCECGSRKYGWTNYLGQFLCWRCADGLPKRGILNRIRGRR